MQFTAEEWAEVRDCVKRIAESQKLVKEHTEVVHAETETIYQILDEKGFDESNLSFVVDGLWTFCSSPAGYGVYEIETVEVGPEL